MKAISNIKDDGAISAHVYYAFHSKSWLILTKALRANATINSHLELGKTVAS